MRELHFETDADMSVPHIHEELEVFYVLSGRVAVMTEQRNFVLGPEDFAVFNPFEHHEMYTEAGSHTLSMYLSDELKELSALGDIRCCSVLHPEKADYLRQIRIKLALIFKNYYETGYDRRLFVLGQVYELLSVFQTQFCAQKTYGNEEKNSGKKKLFPVLRYIGDHYTEPISLNDAAEAVFLSKAYLSMMFHDQMGVSFSDYLRKKRLGKAEYELCYTSHSVLDIALDCGFANVNTFIVNFREEYGTTPADYRRQNAGKLTNDERIIVHESGINPNTYMSLLKYAGLEETAIPLQKKYSSTLPVEVDVRKDSGKVNAVHQRVINVGWAEILFRENVQQTIRTTVTRLGFQFLMFHGILDDSMDVYHEDAEGNMMLSFTYVDLCIDFILRAGAKPWLELGFTPRAMLKSPKDIFGNSCIELPEDLAKWKLLIRGFMEHLLDRYGMEELLSWRFMASSVVYASYGVFTVEQYIKYYQATYEGVKEVLPGCYLSGGGFDTGFLAADGEDALLSYLQYCRTHACMPDALNVQCFSCDYQAEKREDVQKKVSTGSNNFDEPARVSEDPSVLLHQLQNCRDFLMQNGFGTLPIVVNSWNSTLWQADPGNDTCYKSAFIVKNCLESAELTDGIAYNYLTDNSERRIFQSSIFHGGFGLITYQGLHKAGYRAYWLLSEFVRTRTLVEKGDGYAIARSAHGRTIQILLYYYCHYDPRTHLHTALPGEELRTIDRYYAFERNGIKNMEIMLHNLDPGVYHKYTYIVNRESGSSYDVWMNMGFPEQLTDLQEEYIECVSVPKVEYETVFIDASHSLQLSAALDEHEVRLITIKKK